MIDDATHCVNASEQTAAVELSLHANGAHSQVGRLVYWHWVQFRGQIIQLRGNFSICYITIANH